MLLLTLVAVFFVMFFVIRDFSGVCVCVCHVLGDVFFIIGMF